MLDYLTETRSATLIIKIDTIPLEKKVAKPNFRDLLLD